MIKKYSTNKLIRWIFIFRCKMSITFGACVWKTLLNTNAWFWKKTPSCIDECFFREWKMGHEWFCIGYPNPSIYRRWPLNHVTCLASKHYLNLVGWKIIQVTWKISKFWALWFWRGSIVPVFLLNYLNLSTLKMLPLELGPRDIIFSIICTKPHEDATYEISLQ